VKLPAALETLAGATNNNFLYAIGGLNAINGDLQNATFPNQLSYSKLDPIHGSLGAFASQNLWTDSTTQQPVQLARYLCGVVNNGYLYTIDGVLNEPGANPSHVTTNQIWYALIRSDGGLRTWQQASTVLKNGQQLPALQLAATVAVNNYLYIIGGSTAGSLNSGTDWTKPSCCVVGHTYYAKIKTDGSLGVFSQGPDIPMDTTYNATGHLYKTCPVVTGGTIYLSGGENEGGALQTVYYATPDSTTGSFPNGTWNQAMLASMPTMTDAAQAVVYNNGINLLAGDQLGNGHDWPCVYQGVVSGIGGITWSLFAVPQLPVSVSRNAGTTNSNFIYSLGGNQGGTDQKYIYYRSVP
jgi:hypothetical protein